MVCPLHGGGGSGIASAQHSPCCPRPGTRNRTRDICCRRLHSDALPTELLPVSGMEPASLTKQTVSERSARSSDISALGGYVNKVCICAWLLGLVVGFSVWVREVPGSIPGAALVRSMRALTIVHKKSLTSGTRGAAIAQLGDRQTEDLKVPSSIPGLGTSCARMCVLFLGHCGSRDYRLICNQQK